MLSTVSNCAQFAFVLSQYLSDNSKSRTELLKEKLQVIREDNARSERDTGSAEIQSE